MESFLSAPKGNRFWEARSSHGRKPKFEKPDDLWTACVEYFNWVEENPLHTAELVKHQGEATVATLPKMRAMTINGLCIFLDIARSTWDEYRKKSDDFSNIITRAENIIYEQKLSGAAADLLNPNIIARELGLSDKKQVSLEGPLGDRFARAEERLKDAGS
jgi:hypothetical protein